MSAVLFAAALLAAVLGSAMLALSQRRHWQAVTDRPSSTGRPPRWLGWNLLAASFLLTIARDGPSFGALSWPMLVGFSASITAMLLAWTPQVLRPLANWIMPRN